MKSKRKMQSISLGKYFNLGFILPAVLLNVIFFVYPLFRVMYMSLFDWKLLGNQHFIGIKNYIGAFKDYTFTNSLVFTLKYALLVTPMLFILAFVLAL